MIDQIRTYGDPVLKTIALPVEDVTGHTLGLVSRMFDVMDHSNGAIAVAAPQIGVQRQVVVWDLGGGPQAIINPEILDSDGQWSFQEGCLSIPGLYIDMLRPKTVFIRGLNLFGEFVEIEADEIEARMFQHEIDHLNGVLMFDRLEEDERKAALIKYRNLYNGTYEL